MADARNSALETLFIPFNLGLPAGEFALFLGARMHDGLDKFSSSALVLQQFFKPYAAALEAAGHSVQPDIPEDKDMFDTALVLAPKNHVETLYMIACALRGLKDGGVLAVAADNKAGGARMVKNFAFFGLNEAHSESKNKARVVWAQKTGVNEDAVQKALDEGAARAVCNEEFRSIPGIYGWNKIDEGSRLLTQHLPDELAGNGADFGCGYGYLSSHILQRCAGIKALHCVDADWRAVQMCRENISGVAGDTFLDFHWDDLTQASTLHDLDFIVMNPPFHEGKEADPKIGAAFIATAAAALKKGGRLYMVANKQLPYEDVLQQFFTDVKKPCEEQGFKIFCCVK